MNVLVIGANGQIGKKLVHQLKEKGHQPKAMIRKKEQIDQFEKNGIDTVLADLEEDISHALKVWMPSYLQQVPEGIPQNHKQK